MKITMDYIQLNDGSISPTSYYIKIAVFWLIGLIASYFLFPLIWILVAVPATLALAILANGLLFWGSVLYHLTVYKITGQW